VTLLRSAARNISILAVSQLFMWIAAIVFTIAQARYLGPARFGELSVALSYAALLAVVIDFGCEMQLSRLVAQRSSGHDDALAAAMMIRGGLWLLAMPCLVLATLSLGYDRELRESILLVALSVLIFGISNTIGAYLQGREHFLLTAVASIAQRLTAAVVGIAMLLTRPDLTAVASAFVIAGVVNLMVLFVGAHGRLLPPLRVSGRKALALFRDTIPLGVYAIATSVYFGVDMIILQRLAPAENVGWYAAAFRLFRVATILPSVVAGIALYPVLSRLSVDSRAELRAVIDKTLMLLTIAGVAVGLVLTLFAERIVSLLYPAQAYAEAASALRLLAPGLVFIYVNWILASSLLSLHQERRLAIVAVAAAVLNALANLIAISLYKQDGAAATTSLTELFVLVALARLMPRDLLGSESLRVATRTLLAAGATALVLLPIREQELFITVPLALGVFASLAIGLQAVSRTDLLALRALVRFSRAR
jgi:O-antigen/teichoic acid export membrane protein